MVRNLFRKSWLALFLFTGLPVAQADLILSSAPRDSKEVEDDIYKPIADLLSKTTGETVKFRYGDNFLIYQSEMRKGKYDIILDGPAFVGWRMAKLGHTPLVKFPGNLVFAAITKSSQTRINSLKDLAGRTVCAFPPPNLATLTVLYEFENPARQPMIVEVQNFPEAYKNVAAGKCVGGILQAKLFENLDKEAKVGKVLFTSKPLPNQAFSASSRVTAKQRADIVAALLSPEGLIATKKLRDAFKIKELQPATVEEYRGLERLMRDVWGFES